ncbi:MAG: hypothetical protein JW797_15605 [Bradymonadales bacterium]|nr:hypothetical protein [Bradymonadales bacterium]
MKKQVPLFITFLFGTVMILATFIPHYPFKLADTEMSMFFDILAAFAILLGGGNLMRIHVTKVAKHKKGWAYSLITVVGFLTMLIVGLFKLPLGPTSGVGLENSQLYMYKLYQFVLRPLQSTMFALLAFYVASASYRAFRAKNREATMLLLAAFFILLGRTLIGTAITAYLPGIVEIFFAIVLGWVAWDQSKSKNWVIVGLMGAIGLFLLGRTIYGYGVVLTGGEMEFITIPKLVNWIMIYPQMAGQRAIMIGICLGVISMSLRIILGVERSYLGSDTE